MSAAWYGKVGVAVQGFGNLQCASNAKCQRTQSGLCVGYKKAPDVSRALLYGGVKPSKLSGSSLSEVQWVEPGKLRDNVRTCVESLRGL